MIRNYDEYIAVKMYAQQEQKKKLYKSLAGFTFILMWICLCVYLYCQSVSL